MKPIDKARKCRIGIDGYCRMLAYLSRERTADEVTAHMGLNEQTAKFLLRWMLRLKLIHRTSWYRPTEHSRMVAKWIIGADGDVPSPDRDDASAPKKVPSGLILLATTIDILKSEPVTFADLADELAMHQESASRLVRALRKYRLSHVKSWIKPGFGVTVAQHVYGPGNDAMRPPRVPLKQQRAKHYATHRAKKQHLMMICATAGAANQAQAEQAA
jgi:hypothetical protein